MKSTKLVLVAITSLFLVSGVSIYASDAGNPTTPAPGTTDAQDTKKAQNDPSGPKAQDTGTDTTKDSKKDATNPATSSTSTTVPGAATATKKPQKDKEAMDKDTNSK